MIVDTEIAGIFKECCEIRRIAFQHREHNQNRKAQQVGLRRSYVGTYFMSVDCIKISHFCWQVCEVMIVDESMADMNDIPEENIVRAQKKRLAKKKAKAMTSRKLCLSNSSSDEDHHFAELVTVSWNARKLKKVLWKLLLMVWILIGTF